jgi:hypothetical protein
LGKYGDTMSIEGLPRVITISDPVLVFAFALGERFIAPLGSSLMSKDGMIELAGRIALIIAVGIPIGIPIGIAVGIGMSIYGHLTGRAASTYTSSPTIEQLKQQTKMSYSKPRPTQRSMKSLPT